MYEINTYRVVICIGSNSSDRERRVDEAEDFLHGLFRAECLFSPILDSNDASGRSGRRYSNSLCLGDFRGDYDELNSILKRYEEERRHPSDDGEVRIDLDIVLFDGEIKRPGTYISPYFQYLYACLK